MKDDLYLRVLDVYRDIAKKRDQPENVKYIDNLIREEQGKMIQPKYKIPSSKEIKFNESIGQVKCKECNKTITEGYKVNDGEEYFCSDKCLLKSYTPEQVEKMKRNSELPLTSEEYEIGVGNIYWDKFDTNEEEFTDVDDDMGEYWK